MSRYEREQAEWSERGVVIPTYLNDGAGNAIGLPHGAFGFSVEFAKVLHKTTPGKHGTIDPTHKPMLAHTNPRVDIPENPQWNNPGSIISFHARGHRAAIDNLDLLEGGLRFYPTIAITQSVFRRPENIMAIEHGTLAPDGKVLQADGSTKVTDINIDPVWQLSKVAERIGVDSDELRKHIARITGMWDLIKKPYIDLFLPPIDGPNVHIYGDVERLQDRNANIVARSHDFCRDGDNHATRCTCAPFKQFAIEECIKAAQDGGVGIMVYHPEEGRSLGSVIKHLVYNARENGPNGDSSEGYFDATRNVIGGEDARMHWAKPDPYNWLLPHQHVNEWLSESPHKRDQLERYGIHIGKSIALPNDRIPEHANVEITAKRTIGGYNGEHKLA